MCRETGLCRERREYRAGAKQGTWTEWGDGGEKKSVTGYLDGQLDGEYFRWDREGVLSSEGHYRAGEREGEWVFRASSGDVREQGRYERGRRVGEWKSYWDDGKPRSAGAYAWCAEPPRASDGCKQGSWSYWDETGTPASPELDGSRD
jgi:antitoxin component YwqK of YwqJK toxin-antitoxin module